MTDIYFQIIVSILTSGAAAAAAGFVLKTYLSEKIRGKVKSDYDSKLERLRNELQASQNTVNSSLASLNQVFHAGQSERIDAVKFFWEKYLILRDALHPIDSYYGYLTEAEIMSLYTDEWQGNNQIEVELAATPFYKKIGHIAEIAKEVENVRPFLTENLWFLFTSLKTFNGRMLFIYNKGVAKRKIPNWKHDKMLIGVAQQVLSEKEFLYISNLGFKAIIILQQFIEQKIISELSNIVTGHNAAENTFSQATRLASLFTNDGNLNYSQASKLSTN